MSEPQRADSDDVTLGEIGRRLNAMQVEVRDRFDKIEGNLGRHYVPRAELDLRFAGVEQRFADVDRTATERNTTMVADVAAMRADLDAHRKESADDRRAINTGILYPLAVGVLLAVISALATLLIAH